MDKSNKTILVAGATGQQGGAVAHHLMAGGWRIRALTRDRGNAAAEALASRGAEVVEGNMEDRASLDRALEGAYGAFSVQNFWLPGVGFEGEVRQGKNLADAARAAGVEHFVYSSVGGADRNSGLPHFEGKWQIEQHIRDLHLPATIIRPVFLMDNHNWSRPRILSGNFHGLGLNQDKTLQMIAVDDVGAFVALVFDNPGEFVGKAMEIAGDELTESQMAETFSRVIGRPIRHTGEPIDREGRGSDDEGVKTVRWLNESGYQADIPALRRLHPHLMTFEEFLRRSGWENAEPAPASESAGNWAA